jgi:hypothetical protein
MSGTFAISLQRIPFHVDIDIGYFQVLGISSYYSTIEELEDYTEIFGFRAENFRIGTEKHQQLVRITMPASGTDFKAVATSLLKPSLPYISINFTSNNQPPTLSRECR